MKTLGYYNELIDELDKVKIPILDRACYFGDGVYDATTCYNGNIFLIDEHIDRFFKGIEQLNIKAPIERFELKQLLQDLVNKVDKNSGILMVYWQATRGTAIRQHSFLNDMSSNLSVMIYPVLFWNCQIPLKVITLEDTRFLHCNIKTLNLIPNVIAQQKAKMCGCNEAVLHRNGRVTECASSNISIIKEGVFRTAPTNNLILNGISRQRLIYYCNVLDIPVVEEAFTLEELFKADDVIVSSSGMLCVPVSHIDGNEVGGKSNGLMEKLRGAILDEYYEKTGFKH